MSYPVLVSNAATARHPCLHFALPQCMNLPTRSLATASSFLVVLITSWVTRGLRTASILGDLGLHLVPFLLLCIISAIILPASRNVWAQFCSCADQAAGDLRSVPHLAFARFLQVTSFDLMTTPAASTSSTRKSTAPNHGHEGVALTPSPPLPPHELFHMSNPPPQGFAAQLSNFRWAQGSSQPLNVPAHPTGPPPPTSYFSSLQNSISGYVPLRSAERTNEEEAYFALSRWERFIAFLACVVGGLVCFFVAFLTIPFLALKPRKFAVAFTFGSFLFMMGFSVLMGPVAHFKHLISAERLPFSAAYFGSLGLTLYFAVGAKSYIGTLISAIVQVIALLSYLAAYFPGGITTLRFGGQMALRGAGSVLPF